MKGHVTHPHDIYPDGHASDWQKEASWIKNSMRESLESKVDAIKGMMDLHSP